ncbi:MAG: HD domain-containing protein [Bacilli bacterium]|nr:HD domain-containing protein [Bacilli bacterium]
MYKEFDDFVSFFDLNDNSINRKKFHSQRVTLISVKIAEALGWSYHDILLAKQIGHIHDIGKFDEWTTFNKFGNNKFGHGEHGVNILKKNNYINKYNINSEDYNTVYEAVYYQNK